METDRRPRRELRIAGAVAAAVWLSILWVASSVAEVSFPPVAAADRFVRLVPGDVATFFIELLQHWALRLLSLGAFVAFVFVSAELVARTARDARPRAWLAAAVMTPVAALSSLLDPSGAVNWLQSAFVLPLAGGAFAVVVNAVHAQRAGTPEPTGDGVDAGRRAVLKLGVASAAGVAAVGGLAGWLIRRLGGPDTNVELIPPAAPASIPERAAFPDIPGLTPEVTSAADHYVVDINLLKPVVEAEGWRLEVFGEVARSLSLSFTELQERFEVVEEFSVLTCVSNEVGGDLIGHSAWGGVRLRDVLEAAEVTENGSELVLRAADGYSDSFPVRLAMDPSVLLAVSQNGQPLTQEHGFPCRVRIPMLYGMENVKWLETIEVVTSDYRGYWQRRGWDDVAVIKTSSRIDVAGSEFRATSGEATWIAGIAWAGTRGISKVEVSTDGGRTWEEARLEEPITPISWRRWAYRWTPEEGGTHEILCRATDGPGELQLAEEADPHPDGASGYHVVEVDVA